MRSLCLCLAIAGGVLLAGLPVRAADVPVWQPLAIQIARITDDVETKYAAGDAKAARRLVIEAYFGIFEDRKMEAAMRMTLGAKHTYKVEKLFGNLRKAIKKGEDNATIKALAQSIRDAVMRDALALDAADIPAEVFKVNQ